MSKQVSLFFIVEDIEITCKRIAAILEFCCEAGYDAYHIEFTFIEIDVNNLFVVKIIEIERVLKKRLDFTVTYTLSCRFEQIRKLRLRGHAKKRFNVKILLDDIDRLRIFSKTSKRIARFLSKAEIFMKYPAVCELESISKLTCGVDISLRFECVNGVDDNFMSLFSDWLFSKHDFEIKDFTDLIKLILMKERTGCEYNSCLGHVLSFDSSGMVYWCKNNKPETVLGHIDEIKNLSDFLHGGQFEKYLDMHYHKREYCKSNCSRYEICQSGCPLNCGTLHNNKCMEQSFIEVIDHISKGLHRGIDLGDLSVLNKYARTIILNAIAFAPFSGFFDEFGTRAKL